MITGIGLILWLIRDQRCHSTDMSFINLVFIDHVMTYLYSRHYTLFHSNPPHTADSSGPLCCSDIADTPLSLCHSSGGYPCQCFPHTNRADTFHPLWLDRHSNQYHIQFESRLHYSPVSKMSNLTKPVLNGLIPLLRHGIHIQNKHV